MNWRMAAVGAAFCLRTAPALAQHQVDDPYGPIVFLVGSCWAGTFSDGKTVDTHCFSWMWDRQFVKDTHVVNSSPRYEGETTYAFDALNHRLTFRYVSSGGVLLDGVMEERNGTLVSTGSYADAKGLPVALRAEWTLLGKDAYRAVQFQKQGDEWQPTMTVEYHRVAKGP